ncbi:MAG TPA: hypothetical protein IAA29_19970 [Candidatus Paenibacillus intestinavium]|nr:hypothetical protein [Candidatus Paenibacillus intestinavium]
MQLFRSNKFWLVLAIVIIFCGFMVWIVTQNDQSKLVSDEAEPEATPTVLLTDNNEQVGEEATNGPTEVADTTTPTPADELAPQYLTGSLQDDSSYDEEKIESITIQYGSNEPYTIPKDREYVILQSLYWIDLLVAEAKDQTITEDNVMIHINSVDKVVAVPYNITKNTFQLGNKLYYASDGVAMLMYGQFKQESQLAMIDRIYAVAWEESRESEAKVDESFRYDYDQLMINDMDFHGWKQNLLNDSNYINVANYYDNGTDTVSDIRHYEDLAIVSQREVLFISDSVATKDGIKIGLTKEEVLTTLGKPNLERETQWSYQIGDYLKFRLYFENNKVVLISLTLPL